MSAESRFAPIVAAARAASPLAEAATRCASTSTEDDGWLFTFSDREKTVLVRVVVDSNGNATVVNDT